MILSVVMFITIFCVKSLAMKTYGLITMMHCAVVPSFVFIIPLKTSAPYSSNFIASRIISSIDWFLERFFVICFLYASLNNLTDSNVYLYLSGKYLK